MNDKYVPYCIGSWESSESMCEGNKAAEGDMKRPCPWKKYCEPLRKHLENNKLIKIDDYVELGAWEDVKGEKHYYGVPKHGLDNFITFCKLLISRNRLQKRKSSGGTPKKQKDRRINGPTTKAKRAAACRLGELAKQRREYLNMVYHQFKMRLKEGIGGEYQFVLNGSVIAPRNIYCVDKVDKTGDSWIYCKTRRGRDVLIAIFHYNLSKSTFNISLPVAMGDLSCLSETSRSCLSFFEIDEKGCRVKATNLDVEKMAIASDVLVELIFNKKIQLP